jgi:hypothetical protein
MQDQMPLDNQEPMGEPVNTMPPGEVDHEGAMAKADLYKLANYSLKLFKRIDDGDQLEAWVQAKITKAADYIASVYHYMEYEMKFSEYGSKLENSDVYSESQKLEIKNKLMEAKDKIKALKLKQADKETKKEKKVEEAFDDKAKVGDTKKTPTGELTKTSTGVIHKNTSYKDDGDAEDKSGKGKKSHAKSQSAAEKKEQAPKLKQSPKSAKTWGMKDSEKFDNRDKVAEAKTCNESPKGESCPVHGLKECGTMEEGAKPDFLDMDKDGNKKEPMKKAVASKKAGPKKGVNPFAKKKTSKVSEAVKKAKKDYDKDGKVESEKDEVIGSRRKAAGLDEANMPMDMDGATAPPPKGKDGQYPVITSGPNKGKRWTQQAPGPTNPAIKESDLVTESADLARLKTLTKHLLG